MESKEVIELAEKYGYCNFFVLPDKGTLNKWTAHMLMAFHPDDRQKYTELMNTLINAYENDFKGIESGQQLYDDTMGQIKCDDKAYFMTLIHGQVNRMMVDKATKELS